MNSKILTPKLAYFNSSNSNYILLGDWKISCHCNEKSEIKKKNLCEIYLKFTSQADEMEQVYEDTEIIWSPEQVNNKQTFQSFRA